MCVCVQDVDQRTGEDLNPTHNRMLIGGEVGESIGNVSASRNPDRPTNVLTGPVRHDDAPTTTKTVKRMTSPEKWEIKQVSSSWFSLGHPYDVRTMGTSLALRTNVVVLAMQLDNRYNFVDRFSGILWP